MAASAFAVESANIVGYDNSLTSVQGCNFLAVPFNSIGFNTADIQAIQLDDGGNGDIGWGDETFALWEGPPRAVVGSGYVYYYYAPENEGESGYYQWEDDNGDSAYSIDPGQGFVIQCGAGITFRFAGEVSDSDAEQTTVLGCNFMGNPFAKAIDIQAIQLDDGGNGSIGWGDETFALWEGPPRAVVGSGYVYYYYAPENEGETGYYQWEDDNGDSTYSINPGQGFVIQCGAGLTATIESPYSISTL